jgi:hypothetical protein
MSQHAVAVRVAIDGRHGTALLKRSQSWSKMGSNKDSVALVCVLLFYGQTRVRYAQAGVERTQKVQKEKEFTMM